MNKIQVKAGFVTREYSLGDTGVFITTHNAPFLIQMLQGLPKTMEWNVPYVDLGLARDKLEAGLKKIKEGNMIQDAFPNLSADKVEMLLDHPDLRLP